MYLDKLKKVYLFFCGEDGCKLKFLLYNFLLNFMFRIINMIVNNNIHYI